LNNKINLFSLKEDEEDLIFDYNNYNNYNENDNLFLNPNNNFLEKNFKNPELDLNEKVKFENNSQKTKRINFSYLSHDNDQIICKSKKVSTVRTYILEYEENDSDEIIKIFNK